MKRESLDLALEQKAKDFSVLVEQIDGISDKKKRLWKEIYENAVVDRQNAYVLFSSLVDLVENDSTEHAVHGKNLSTYIERMSKANDQLIKLSELITKAESVESSIDPEEMFRRING